MLRYIVKNFLKYGDFFNRQIRASILPTKYCNSKFCISYSKPVIFLQETVFFFFLHKNCKTNKIQLFVKMFKIYCSFDSDKL